MDHFSPSYFALLGPIDQAKLAEAIIPEEIRRILKSLSVNGVTFLLGGDMALTLHGIPGRSADLDLLIDSDESNIQRFIETMGSEHIDLAGSVNLERLNDTEINASFYLRLLDSSGFQIQFLSKISLLFEEAYERRVSFLSGSLTIDLVSIEDLVLIKSDSDDPPDLDDAKVLERIRRGV
jgi:hypothetical protein